MCPSRGLQGTLVHKVICAGIGVEERMMKKRRMMEKEERKRKDVKGERERRRLGRMWGGLMGRCVEG